MDTSYKLSMGSRNGAFFGGVGGTLSPLTGGGGAGFFFVLGIGFGGEVLAATDVGAGHE